MMKPIDRRAFLASSAVAALLTSIKSAPAEPEAPQNQSSTEKSEFNSVVDFRFAPADYQTAICFPDDPAKTVVGKHGELRYDFPRNNLAGINEFGTIAAFGLCGMEAPAWVEQKLEAPGIPIVHTRYDTPRARMELVAFASNRASEGRVDNVLLEILAKKDDVFAEPLIHIRSAKKYRVQQGANSSVEVFREEESTPWMVCAALADRTSEMYWDIAEGEYLLTLQHGKATSSNPLRYFIRFPQPGSNAGNVTAANPDSLLDDVREWWRKWHAFGGSVEWSAPGIGGEFLSACARNIQQAREIKNDKLVFQVGPTVYRGLWIVDGNFILEAARYLGFDDAADEGLLSEWNQQVSTGQIIASGGKEHWKDTAIAFFTLVRACELKQDWSLLRQLAPRVGHAIEFLISLRDEARKGDSPNGKYGLLAPGFPDGGIGGIRFEFTNTLWALAGLKAISKANETLHLSDLDRAGSFYRELRAALDAAAKDQIVRDPRGFDYLPMVMREDPEMHKSEWDRPRPQSAQWALSQTIFPGDVFAKDDPIVRGHIALMQACTQEDIPAETGWLHHEGIWNYNAAFVAEVYLWAGMRAWAHRTFTGYLNHASPLLTWREEQPLQHALVGGLWGDMPHNWASAECIRFLRHRLVLEDGQSLRLLDGVLAADLSERKPFLLKDTPTRFGRVGLTLEPSGAKGWKAHFVKKNGPAPNLLLLNSRMGPARLGRIVGAAQTPHSTDAVAVDVAASEWTAYWD